MVHRKYSFNKTDQKRLLSPDVIDNSVSYQESLTGRMEPRASFLLLHTKDNRSTLVKRDLSGRELGRKRESLPGSTDNFEARKSMMEARDSLVPTEGKSPKLWQTSSGVDPAKERRPRISQSVYTRPRKSPLRFCKLIVNYPKLAFFLTFSVHVFFVTATLALVFTDYDIFPTYFKEMPLDVRDDDTYKRVHAWYDRKTALNGPKFVWPSTPSSAGGVTQLVIFFKGDNVLTKKNLKEILKVENYIQGILERDHACMRDYSQSGFKCKQVESPSRIFKLLDSNHSNIPLTLYTVMKMDKKKIQWFLATDAVITPTVAKSSATRILFQLRDFNDKLRLTAETYLITVLRDNLYDLAEKGAGDMSIYFYSLQLFLHDIYHQVISDLMWAIGSFLFIFLFMLVQTGSLFLTSLSIASILSSFLGANLIYRIVLDYRYFGLFHVLSVFIILGIGADDVFVFHDTWRATAYEQHGNIAERLSSCYRRATLSMLITSFTTMMAFVSNSLSPLLPISSFGVFSAVLVMVNYLSVITFFPACIIIYHRTLESWKWPCFRWCAGMTRFWNDTSSIDVQEKTGHDPNKVVRFFRGPYHRAVTHRWWKWVFIAVALAAMAPFASSIFDIEISKSQVQFYRYGHLYYYSQKLNEGGFMRNRDEDTVSVLIVFGIKTLDLSECHKTDFRCQGTVIFDDAFDLNPKPAQLAVMAMCDKIANLTDREELRIMWDPDTKQVKLMCFINTLDKYYREISRKEPFRSVGANLSLPTSEIKFEKFFEINTFLYGTNIAKNYNFYRYFETLCEYWWHEGYFYPKGRFKVYKELIGEEIDQRDTSLLRNGFSFYGLRLRYAAIKVDINVSAEREDFQTGLKHHDAWEKFVNEEMKNMPPSVQGWQTATFSTWHTFRRQEALIKSATQGMIVGLCLSLIVLTLATTNVIIAVLATFTMGLVTITVCGAIPLFGWKISAIESINLSLVVGLAVDYVVHLSEGYHQSPQRDRVDKVRDMLESRGISVTSGAFTTIGASAFMMGVQIQFFLQFGIFLFLIIGFSWFYSLCLFTPIMATIGPQGNCGSLMPVIKGIWDKLRGRTSEDVDCDRCDGLGFHGPENHEILNKLRAFKETPRPSGESAL